MKLKILLMVLVGVLTLSCLAQKDTSDSEKLTSEKNQRMPEFPGGNNAFYDYLDKNVILPDGFDKKYYLKKNKNEYVPISVGFTIDVDGSITNVKIIDGDNEMLEKKAMEIVKNMPKWNPGYQNGIPIKVQYAIPVRFNLM